MSDPSHKEIAGWAALAFADHRLKPSRSRCWRLSKPGTGIYGFRVTWVPGALIITGDLGEQVYKGVSHFADPWTAAELVAGSGWHYLTGKSLAQQEFSPDATVEHIVQIADYAFTEADDDSLWRKLFDEYGLEPCAPVTVLNREVVAEQMRADGFLDAAKVYDLTGDSEAPCYQHNPQTRWHFEALSLWARTMLAAEPRWHRLLRLAMGLREVVKGYRRYPVIYRPPLYAATGGALNGARFWTPIDYVHQGQAKRYFAGLSPWKLGRWDLSHLGLWRRQGSSWTNEDGRLRPFVGATHG